MNILDGNPYAAKDPIGRSSSDVVVRWKNCPHCDGRGTFLANPFFIRFNGAIHHQCLSCTRAQEFWKANSREPTAAELAALFPEVPPPAPPAPPEPKRRAPRKPAAERRPRRIRARPERSPVHFGTLPTWSRSYLAPLCGIYGTHEQPKSSESCDYVTCRRCLAILATDPTRVADVGMALEPGALVRGAAGSTLAIPARPLDIGDRIKLIDAAGVDLRSGFLLRYFAGGRERVRWAT